MYHPQYKETEARVEFVDPFFEAPGIRGENKLCRREIEATDAEIDALVHELYGLTEEEIKTAEKAT